MPEDRDGSKKPDLSREFEKETTQTVWQDRDFRMHSDDTLEKWRDKLADEREHPAPAPRPTIGGTEVQALRERDAERREEMIRRIDAELMYRLMTERDREGYDPGEGRER